MCLPAAAVAMVASGGIQAAGQVMAGRQNQSIANRNAAMLETSALDALERGRTDVQLLREQVSQRIGTQRAGLSAANVDISRGSAANLVADTALVGEVEVLRTLNNAAREAYGMTTQAAFTRAEGVAARRASYLGAGATLLTAGSTAYGMRRSLSNGTMPALPVRGR